jgi:hypothetical protein
MSMTAERWGFYNRGLADVTFDGYPIAPPVRDEAPGGQLSRLAWRIARAWRKLRAGLYSGEARALRRFLRDSRPVHAPERVAHVAVLLFGGAEAGGRKWRPCPMGYQRRWEWSER